MTDAVLKSITRYNMLPPGTRAAVAVSGGPDSVCLLHVLVDLAPKLGIQISVAHLNHKLRGADSDEDERFVEQMVERLGVPFHSESADWTAREANLEQAARTARRGFFSRLIEAGQADRVALGHTRDDQAETVLFRLLRGSGLAGLAGVLPVTADGIVRPLIRIARGDVLEYLCSRGISWREDATNREPRFARNRIRHTLLPKLAKEWNPNLAETLANLGDLAYEEERVWRDVVDQLASRQFYRRASGIEISCEAIRSLPISVARRLLREAIAEARGDLRRIEFSHVEKVLELAGHSETSRPGTRQSGAKRRPLPGLIAEKSFGWLRLQSNEVQELLRETTLTVPGSYPVPGDNTIIRLELVDGKSGPYPCATLKAAEVDASQAEAALVLRSWLPGDHFWPAGDSRDRKIHELFQAARVPSWRRRNWPMISCGDKILWVRQFGAANEFLPRPGSGRILRVTEDFGGK